MRNSFQKRSLTSTPSILAESASLASAVSIVIFFLYAITKCMASRLLKGVLRNENLITPETDYMSIDAVEQFVLC